MLVGKEVWVKVVGTCVFEKRGEPVEEGWWVDVV
jgi:hypothetical protein